MHLRRNHALWVGPLLALAGFLSYYTIFYRWPVTRDVPWLNVGLLLAAVGISAAGLSRAWRRGGWRRTSGIAGLAWSTVVTVLFVLSCTVMSKLPPAPGALAVGAQVPAVTLADQTGAPVDLAAAAADGPLVVVFYRGFW